MANDTTTEHDTTTEQGTTTEHGTTTEQNGLQALRGGATAVLRALDSVFEGWGVAAGAESVILPPVLPVAALAKLDFYENFPHHAFVVSALDLDRRGIGYGSELLDFPPDKLEPAELGLPSAACFAVYLHLQGRRLAASRTVTVLGRCFRREEYYEGLRRLVGFHMREVVALGSNEFTAEHLRRFSDRILAFGAALELPMSRDAATDPFYDRGGQRALLQKLAPVKHEFVVEGLAIASVNVHRNFFGERCDIRLADTGAPVFTSCAAFGLERWLSVLHTRYGSWPAALAAVRAAARRVALTAGVALPAGAGGSVDAPRP
ncbi:MAG: hypothetical protein ACJ74U_14125 [Jatrophihabitantaceae bacterium]